MTSQVAGVVTIIGSVLFLVGAALPISQVFVESAPDRKLQLLRTSPRAWAAANVLFGVGATLAAAGLILAAATLAHPSTTWLVYLSGLALVVGTLGWVWHLYARVVDAQAFAAGQQRTGPLLAYFVLTPAAFAALGVVFVHSPLPAWVGWLLVVSMAIVLVLTAVWRDIAPFVYYVPALIAGSMLLL